MMDNPTPKPPTAAGACHVSSGDAIAVMLRRWARCRPPMERYLAVDDALLRSAAYRLSALPETIQAQANGWMMASVLLDEAVQWALPRWAKARFGHWVRMGGIHTGVLAPLASWLDEDNVSIRYDLATQASIAAWASDFPVVLPQGWFKQVPTPQGLAYVVLLVTFVVTNGPLSLGVWPWHQWLSCSPNHSTDDPLLSGLVERYRAIQSGLENWPSLTECSYSALVAAVTPGLLQSTRSALSPPDVVRGRWESRPRWGAVLVEGISEQYVLPMLAEAMGNPLWKLGLDVVAAGGKHPMVSLVATLKEQQYLGPLAVLLDADGRTEAAVVAPLMEPGDALLCFTHGALEDAYTDGLLVEVINGYFQPVEPLTADDVAQARLRCPAAAQDNLALMAELWHFYELSPPDKPGSFDKVMLAQCVADFVSGQAQKGSKPVDLSPWFSPEMVAWLHQVVQGAGQAQQGCVPKLLGVEPLS